MNRDILVGVVTDCCAFATKPSSVFKKTFDAAGQGYSSAVGSLSIGFEAQPSVGSPSGP